MGVSELRELRQLRDENRTLKRALDPHNLMNPGKLVEI